MYFSSFLIVLLFYIGISCELQQRETHFYCRICGLVIANYSSLITKQAESVDGYGVLSQQRDTIVIPYESFDSSKNWKGKKLMYFQNASHLTTISAETQDSLHFHGHKFSYVTCDNCKSMLGYYIEKKLEEDEFGEEDSPDDFRDYDKEDIADLMAIPSDKIENHIETILSSIPPLIRTTGYWSYRYIHKEGVEQYHTKQAGIEDDINLFWSLGTYSEERSGLYGIDFTVNPLQPYFSYSYINGQMCDETHSSRETEVRFIACEQKMVAQFRSIDEISTCRYVIRICIPSLIKKRIHKVDKQGFYALSLDSVIPSSDVKLQALLERDIYADSILLDK